MALRRPPGGVPRTLGTTGLKKPFVHQAVKKTTDTKEEIKCGSLEMLLRFRFVK